MSDRFFSYTNTARTRLYWCSLLLSVFILPTANAGERYSPTVTRAEAEIISSAQKISVTNLTAASVYLDDKRDGETSAALDFALGNFYFQAGDIARAEAAYLVSVGKMPQFRDATGNLGRIYLMQGKPEKTTALCSELIENDIPNADIYRLLGHAHLMSEHYISAENAFRQCLLLRPEDNEAMLGLAKCLLQEERYKECHSLMEELLSENPENPELWSLRANTAIALDDQEQALVSIESARRLNAATADMLATLGDIYINRQQIREALTAYEKSFSGQPPSFNRIIRAARGLLSIGSSSEATKMLERANSLSENSFTPSQTVKILKLRAAIANQDGDTNRAVKIYRQALKQAPLNGDILLALADIERGRGDIETSKMNAERAARLPGFEARAFVMLAQLEVERENYTAAADLLEKSLSFKDQKHIRQYLGRVRRLTDR